jgi:hypothetical protein
MSAPLVARWEGAVRIRSSCLLLALAAVCTTLLFGQNLTNPEEYSFTISSAQPWTDTGVDLSAGEALTFTAQTKSGEKCDPNGATASENEKLPAANLAAGALIAKISENSDPLLVGSSRELKSEGTGQLFLGVNQSGKSDCSFTVKVKITKAEASSQPQPRNLKDQLSSAAKVWMQGQFGGSQSSKTESSSAVTGTSPSGTTIPSSNSPGLKLPAVLLDADLRGHVDELPRRVHDHAGNLGDMVNFVIVGSKEQTQAALEAAKWHLADVDSKEAGLKAILNTYQKKEYLEMPMSHLFLFDRMQDFGYEQAQAFSVVASRHHFRIWKAPFTWHDHDVWVGAGTHDIGFEKDIRTGHLTHKIDPDVDQERENIGQSLEKSGKAKNMTYYLPPNPVQEAKNASGGGYHSDGRLLVIFLN